MVAIIYGFDSNIANHDIKEVCFFLMTFAVMLIVVGRYVDVHSINDQYMRLIRYKKIASCWKCIWLRVICVSVAEVIILFLIMAVANCFTYWEMFERGFAYPLLLWILSISMFGCLQLQLSIFPKGFLLSFLLFIGIEVFSIYAYPLIGKWTAVLPGSYMMLRRTSTMTGVMPIGIVIVIEMAVVFLIGLFGHRLYRWRNC